MVFYKRVLISLIFSGVLLATAWAGAADDFIIRPGVDQKLTPSTSTKETTNNNNGAASSRRWIMAVGICKFADTRISPLTYCVADARSISGYFKTDGVPDNQIILLADESAKKDSVLSSLKRISEGIAPDDSLFFFYSSHGAGDSLGKTYFITFDTVIDDLATTALPMQELKNAVKEIKCRNIVMMIDTCHSGGAKSLGRQDEKAFDKLVRTADRGTRIAILTSS
ncbi:MAG: caspase family protein, partial [Pseudomonadota bacterium]|nr:caspase family protein [Pseudomonadota bacterium]